LPFSRHRGNQIITTQWHLHTPFFVPGEFSATGHPKLSNSLTFSRIYSLREFGQLTAFGFGVVLYLMAVASGDSEFAFSPESHITSSPSL
jgi:hypothetical protein